MSKIEQNREKKRRAILDSAKSVFLSEGYSAASMDEIAAQAKITKQTLYRYFPSKIQLFHAALQQIGANYNDRSSQHLALQDTREALIAFATEFVQFHLSPEHIATQRLLIVEAAQAPEVVESFMNIGPNDTHHVLEAFFYERLGLTQAKTKIELWLGMLLAPRSGALLGLAAWSQAQIEQHAIEATDLLLTSIK